MDKMKCMVIIKGCPYDDVISYWYDKNTKRKMVEFSNGKTFPYGYNSVVWLRNPMEINLSEYSFTNSTGSTLNNIRKCLKFESSCDSYFRFFYNDGTIRSYNESDLEIEHNALASEKVKSLFDYYKQISQITGLKSDDGTNTLTSKFEKNSFISEKTVLAKYFNAEQVNQNKIVSETVLFPFGCNLSQMEAVKKALYNQVSVIEGPPGTGKTQTILNIIANLVVKGKTVEIVSNNNDATSNVYEKLQKYGFNYIAAELGSTKNKELFINEKQTTYPDFANDIISMDKLNTIISDINTLESDLIKMLESKNRVAMLKEELSALLVENHYFEEYFNLLYEDKSIFKRLDKLTSSTILNLWNECENIVENGGVISFWTKIKYIFKYRINSFSLFKDNAKELIPHYKKLFYILKKSEIEKEIIDLDSKLSRYGCEEKMSLLSDMSNLVLRHSLAKKYMSQTRKMFTYDDLWKDSTAIINEYPVILSSTYSAISSLSGVVYDYVIIDEASQVDLATGVLAMACAKNIVVVGDLKQLPNVITDEIKWKCSSISNTLNISVKFRQEEQSLLSSVCAVFEDAPRTLLREHYRCHPKIIEFCNKKFYNNQLIIMTEDNDEEDVLRVYITAKGNHARGHFNQRQIDEIKTNIIPELRSKNLGIITPYRTQTRALTEQLDATIPISTVHKFQGRENNDIIISTVDNEITEFTDNPNMLNVAVSRAKNRLCLVISDNEKNENTNIGDLVKYIEYNNFEIKRSDIFSVFDLLYKGFEETRKEYLIKHKKVSVYDSENLMYAVIEEVLGQDRFSKLRTVVHQPLNSIIRDLRKLNDSEARFVMNYWAHVDLLIYSQIDKSPILAIEVDGYENHKVGTEQHERDILKDRILGKYNIPIMRFNTTGSSEKEKLELKLISILQ
ncbi:MAG: AAA domain-containing protein [Erysipelotrichaceae bacterium]